MTAYSLHDESWLPLFRKFDLAPEVVLARIEANPQTLFRLSTGVGKSFAIDQLLKHPELYLRFKRVIYAAPTWAIIKGRVPFTDPEFSKQVSWVALEPRPNALCGPERRRQWKALEKCGLFALGRDQICKSCPNYTSCPWPKTLKQKIGEAHLILITEQHLRAIPDLLSRIRTFDLKANQPLAGSGDETLLILDEAKFATADFRERIKPEELPAFGHCLQELLRRGALKEDVAKPWIQACRSLLEIANGTRALDDLQCQLPKGLHGKASEIQLQGVIGFGQKFRYLGYLIQQLQDSLSDERWIGFNGTITFICRPYLGHKLAVFSAELRRTYAARQFRLPKLVSPYESVRFIHAETKVWNLINSRGAMSWFPSHKKQLLDFYSVLILRNIVRGKSTMLVGKKDFKPAIAEYLEQRLKDWGYSIRVVFENYEQLRVQGKTEPDPTVIPLIHYGMTGINDFERYQTCYCVMSFNCSPKGMNDNFQSTPQKPRMKVIPDKKTGYRVPEVLQSGEHQPEDLEHAIDTLFHLEVEISVQAAARCRFCISPREVGFFQRADFSQILGTPVQEFRTLKAAYKGLGIPRAKDLDTLTLALKIKELLSQGHSQKTAANTLGISQSRITRIKKSANFGNHIYDNIIYGFQNCPIGESQ